MGDGGREHSSENQLRQDNFPRTPVSRTKSEKIKPKFTKSGHFCRSDSPHDLTCHCSRVLGNAVALRLKPLIEAEKHCLTEYRQAVAHSFPFVPDGVTKNPSRYRRHSSQAVSRKPFCRRATQSPKQTWMNDVLTDCRRDKAPKNDGGHGVQNLLARLLATHHQRD